MLARHFNVQTTTVSTHSVVSMFFFLFTASKPLHLSRRKAASQEELVALETDRLLREQIEDGCELFLNSNNS